MRRVAPPPCPAVLAEVGSPAARERAAAIAHYGRRPPPTTAYPFSVYSDKGLKAALNAAFSFKCAYCESFYGATAPVDVEHYRPKGVVVTPNGRKLKPGYYWLAAEWDNLLPSCIDCNRAREQEDAAGATGLSGKAMQFPLADERRRVRKRGRVDREVPLLLHPYHDEPDHHLELGEEGVLRPAPGPSPKAPEDARGRATIDVTGLNRVQLVHARARHRHRVELQLERVEDAEDNIRRHPKDANLEDQLRRELEELKLLQEDDAPYTFVTAQLIARHRPRGRGRRGSARRRGA